MSDEEPLNPKWLRIWTLGLIAAAVAVAVIVVRSLSSSDDGEESSGARVATSRVTSAVSPTTPTTRPTSPPTTPLARVTTAPVATVAAKLGDRATPVPVGTEARFEAGWSVKVVGVSPDATAAIRATNQFNDPPPAGHQFYMVSISATYIGQGSSMPLGNLRFSALDSGNTQISEGECGVTPSDFDVFKEVFTGGTLTGNICFVVPSATVASLVLYVDAGAFSRQRVFFALG